MIKEQSPSESRNIVSELSSHDPLTGTEIASGAANKLNLRKAVLAVAAGVLLLAGASKAWSSYSFGQSHAETDDAYVTGDLVNISPTVSGTLAELTVEDGDFVHKGQLIARLNHNGSSAELAQAEANFEAAQSQVPQAEASLAFTKLSTDAAIRSSRASIATQSAKTEGSR